MLIKFNVLSKFLQCILDLISVFYLLNLTLLRGVV